MTPSGKWPITQLTKGSIVCFPIPHGTLFFHPNTTWAPSQGNLKTIRYAIFFFVVVGGGGNRMDRSHLSHNIPCLPEKNFVSALSSISPQTSLENAKFGGGRYITRDVQMGNGAGRNSQLRFFSCLLHYLCVSLRKKIMHPLSVEPLTYPLYGPTPKPSPPPPHKQSPSINPRYVWCERILVWQSQ